MLKFFLSSWMQLSFGSIQHFRIVYLQSLFHSSSCSNHHILCFFYIWARQRYFGLLCYESILFVIFNWICWYWCAVLFFSSYLSSIIIEVFRINYRIRWPCFQSFVMEQEKWLWESTFIEAIKISGICCFIFGWYGTIIKLYSWKRASKTGVKQVSKKVLTIFKKHSFLHFFLFWKAKSLFTATESYIRYI